MSEYGEPLPADELVKRARELKPWNRPGAWAPTAYEAPAIAGSSQDQTVPEGVENPLWEIVRHTPGTRMWRRGERIEPDGFHSVMQAGFEQLGRSALCVRFSWSIPSPGDMTWLAKLLDGRGIVEIGAGSGYWAWQMAQAGIDVLAFDPHRPGPDNRYVQHQLYYPVLDGDDRMAAHYPDRALLLCWPPYCDPVAADALRAYAGDLLIYIGEGAGGCCADDEFFKVLDAEWDETGESPFHVTWWGIHCRMTAYRRRVKAVEA